MIKRLSFSLAIILVFFLSPGATDVKAQTSPASGPVYVVQAGDSLWDIARRFNISLDELIQANNLANSAVIKPGDELVIPGLEGVTGRLETQTLALGETLTSLSRDAHIPQHLLMRLNRVLSPNEFYAGREVIVPFQADEAGNPRPSWERLYLAEGQSALEIAVLNGVNPWHIALGSGYSESASLLPGDILRLGGKPAGEAKINVGALIPVIQEALLENMPLVQGRTAVIRIVAPEELDIQGVMIDRPLNFFYTDAEEWVALQGIHARTEPGLYPLSLQITSPNGMEWSFSQRIRVVEGNYPFDPELVVDPATVDPEVTKPEDEQWAALTAPVTPEKLWDGLFSSPVDRDFADCFPSRFGNRRSYNNSGYLYFHTGLDFCGSVGNAIYAPAAGEVVFHGPLTVRGNATVINHGWGVYTAYMHQSEILVQVGDKVEAGQLIGRVGNTGRVSGPHLHLEVWVGGVQVDPLEWLQRVFP